MKSLYIVSLLLTVIVIEDAVIAAPGCIQVYCKMDPCIYTTCPSGTTCRANYCGGCNAECIGHSFLDLGSSIV